MAISPIPQDWETVVLSLDEVIDLCLLTMSMRPYRAIIAHRKLPTGWRSRLTNGYSFHRVFGEGALNLLCVCAGMANF
jgi:hypothetical protein